MRKSDKISAITLFFIFAVVVSGCDKIPFLKEYFGPKAEQPVKPVSAAQPVQAVPAPAAQQASSAEKPLADNELARIGSWSITIEEFNERLGRLKEVVPDFDPSDVETKKLILDELIRQQLLVLDAEESGTANTKDIKDAVEEFRRTLLVREIANNITKEITVSDQEAEDYYNQNKDSLVEPAEWHVREIVSDTEDAAKEILVSLYGGADFAQVAKERSKGKTAENGGDLGFVAESSSPQMQSALMSLDVGGISSVIKGADEKFYIVKVEEKRGGAVQEFTAIKGEIIKGLTLLKQQQAIVEHLNTLATKIPTKVNDKLLEK